MQDRASASRPGRAAVSSSEEIGKSPDDVSRRDDNGAVIALSLPPSLPPRFPLDRLLSFLTPINTSPPKLSRNVIDIDVVLTKEDLQDIIEKSFGSASSEEFLTYEN